MAVQLGSSKAVRFQSLGNQMRIYGPLGVLDTLRTYLHSHDIESRFTRDPLGNTICLDIPPGPQSEDVRSLVDEWTE